MLETRGKIISLAEEKFLRQIEEVKKMSKAQAERVSPGLSLLPDLLNSTPETRKDFFKVWSHSPLLSDRKKKPENGKQKRIVMIGIPGVPNKMFGADHPYYFNPNKMRKALQKMFNQDIDLVICPWAFALPLAMKDPESNNLIYIPQESAFSTLFYFLAIVENESDYAKAVQSYIDSIYGKSNDYKLRINLQHSGGWEIMKQYMMRHNGDMNGGKDLGISLGSPNSVLFGWNRPNDLINLGRDMKFQPSFAYYAAKGKYDFFTAPDSPFIESSPNLYDPQCFRVYDTGIIMSNSPIIHSAFVGAAHANLMTDPFVIADMCEHFGNNVDWNELLAA